ncbi:glycerophosphoryl diester phosphodiesterase membrane domain-containing protein [Sphingopyxis sp. PET50]|uniref:glycerophosphoryl diester phosphodiesterase membrane domain-containing protein n=1 Tax=Sphingopyxis sp. PET50 TaxID=2976533 RepID=UPI0021B03962|nr:glycerophosphoryl diester phosphodiesterase membrane domain-containing protein [Sphingopyxis sp. PET50]
MATFRESMRQMVGFQLLVSVLGMIGGTAVLRLWLSRVSTSVGDALVFAIKLLPTMIAIQLLLGVAAVAVAFLALMPALAAGSSAIGILLAFVGVVGLLALLFYLWGRLSVISPVVADRATYNPFTAIQQSWQLTKDNGWRIFLFLFLVILVIVVAALIAYFIVAVLSGAGEGVERFLKGVVDGGFTAVVGFVSLAVSAAAYRQLALRGGNDIFS